MKSILIFLSFFTVIACRDTAEVSNNASRSPSSRMNSEFPPELGEQWNENNDSQAKKITDIFKGMLEEKMKTDPMVRRDAHPKHHACVKAKLTIDPRKLASNLQVGLYSKASSYDAWIRFSNGDPDANKPDIEGDVRGMAIKILNASNAGNHDLVMINSERFFSRDGDDYLDLSKALTGGGLKMAWYFAQNPKNAAIILKARDQVASPLWVNYFSAVPYKLGDHSMRFSVVPCAQNGMYKDIPSKKTSPNYLRERLVETLLRQDTCFDLYVQPNMEPQENIVENPTYDWSKKKSPLISVGRIVIPQQSDLVTKEKMNFCENISMDPWRAHAENRPLGQINRIRKIVYPEISRFRHEANGLREIEPRDLNPCEGETSDLCHSR